MVGLRVHSLLLRHNFRRELINVVFCLLSLHFKLLESVELILLRHREWLWLALSLRLHLWLSKSLLKRRLVGWLLKLMLLAILERATVHLLLLAYRCWVVRDLHLVLALLVVRFFLNFLSSQPEQILELLYVVIILLRLASKLFSHIQTVAIPRLLARPFVRNHRGEVLRQRVVVGVLI